MHPVPPPSPTRAAHSSPTRPPSAASPAPAASPPTHTCTAAAFAFAASASASPPPPRTTNTNVPPSSKSSASYISTGSKLGYSNRRGRAAFEDPAALAAAAAARDFSASSSSAPTSPRSLFFAPPASSPVHGTAAPHPAAAALRSPRANISNSPSYAATEKAEEEEEDSAESAAFSPNASRSHASPRRPGAATRAVAATSSPSFVSPAPRLVPPRASYARSCLANVFARDSNVSRSAQRGPTQTWHSPEGAATTNAPRSSRRRDHASKSV